MVAYRLSVSAGDYFSRGDWYFRFFPPRLIPPREHTPPTRRHSPSRVCFVLNTI